MVDKLLRLDGRLVIVSGAGGGGIGTEIVRLIARAGASVLAVDCSPERLDRDIVPLRDEGLEIATVAADILSDEGVAAVMSAAANAPGDLYGLVTVVGGAPPETWGPTTRLSRRHWRDQMVLNAESMLFLAQAVVAELKRQKTPGAIVSIASICGLTASPYNSGYGAGKAALLSVVQTMGLEFARDGIRVNAVAPGATVTPTAHLNSDPQLLRRGIPMARTASPEEIAAPVLFLLSDMASYMTGQCLTVDGGCNLRWTHLSDENLPMFLKKESVEQVRSGGLGVQDR